MLGMLNSVSKQLQRQMLIVAALTQCVAHARLCCWLLWGCWMLLLGLLGEVCNECVCLVLGDPKCNSNVFLMVLQTGYEGKRRVCFFGMTKLQ